jgi:peroxiredoxin
MGDKAPDFTLNTLDKKSVQLKKLEEDGPVVLVVLRGWPGYQCPICTAQVGELVQKADGFAQDGAKVVLVYPGPADQLDVHAADFIKDKKIPFVFLTDPDFAMVNAYDLRWDAKGETSYPSTFVLSQDGMVQYAKVSHTHGDRAPTADILGALSKLKASATQPAK